MTEALEIERRFLLTSYPQIPEAFTGSLKESFITQFYTVNRKRYRKTELLATGELEFDITTKKRKSDSASMESITEISQEEWESVKPTATRIISKSRKSFLIRQSQGYVKWEIDQFQDGTVIVEAEIPSEDFDLHIPDFIKEVVMKEITGDSSLSNYSMAKRLD